MPDDNKTQEFLQKLAPCIERGDLDACAEEAALVVQEMGIGGGGRVAGVIWSRGYERQTRFHLCACTCGGTGT
jgi:hypothetical protein